MYTIKPFNQVAFFNNFMLNKNVFTILLCLLADTIYGVFYRNILNIGYQTVQTSSSWIYYSGSFGCTIFYLECVDSFNMNERQLIIF